MAQAKITKAGVEVDLTGITASERRRKMVIPEGNYLAKIVKAETTKFSTNSRGVTWEVEVVTDGKGKGAHLWYNNVLVNADGSVADNSLWSFKGFLQAIEPRIKIPDRLIKIPVAKLAGRQVAIEVVDGEDDQGRPRSEIADVFHPDLLEEDEDLDDLDDLDEEEDDEFEDEEEEDGDEDDDEFDLDEDEL